MSGREWEAFMINALGINVSDSGVAVYVSCDVVSTRGWESHTRANRRC